MADRYWISNTNSTANTAGNWNTAADGSGSTGVPTTNDTVFIGHATTLAADKGNGICTWDIATTLTAMTVYSGYNSLSETSTAISFTAASTITHADADWDSLGYRVGMKIVVTGATNAANNATLTVASITQNVLVVSETSVVTEAAGASVTVAYNAYLDVQANFTVNLLTLDGNIRNSSGSANTITFSGSHAGGGDNRYILNGENQTVTAADLVYSVDGSANGSTATYFDDGNYPTTNITGSTTISFGHKAPTSDAHGKATFAAFTTGASVTTAVDASATPLNNQSRVFFVEAASGFAVAGTTFDAGKSSWEFQLDGSSFAFPVSDGTTTYNWYNLTISSKTAGRKATIASNRTLSANSITVGVNAVLEGHKTRSGATSTIVSVRRPKILGAWNFSQVSDGIYASLMETAFPITPSQGPSTGVQLSNGAGAFTNDENLSFANDTLSVDKGVKFLENTDHPTTPAAGIGVLWVKNTAPNTLVFTDDAGTDTTLGSGGGGGSGTVTSVATSAPITGGTITATGTIGISAATTSAAGSMSAADKTKLDGIAASATATAAPAVEDNSGTPALASGITKAEMQSLLGIVPLQHFRLRMKSNSNAVNYLVTGSYTVLDIANTSIWEKTTTGAHADIVLVNDTNDHVTLSAGGIYQIVVSIEFFPSSSQQRDMWLVVSTDASSTGQLGTDRLQSESTGGVGNVQLKHTVVYEIPNAGSDTDIYFSLRSNGNNSNIIAFTSGSNRSSITITRIGDAIS